MFQDAHLITSTAICLEAHFEGQNRSKLTTTEGVFFSELLPTELLNHTCLKYGSTLEGRIQAVRELLKYEQKTPFIIIPFSVGAAPIISPSHPDCIYLFNHFFTVEQTTTPKVSLLTFSTGQTITIPTSAYSLARQQKRLHTALNTFQTLK